MKNLISILALILLISCENSNQKTYSNNNSDTSKSNEIISKDTIESQFATEEINCDSIYPNRGYKLVLTSTGEINQEEQFKLIFEFLQLKNRKQTEIYGDKIFSTVKEVRFEDFNNDKVKDILIQNSSDARSNWTYTLYLVDTINNKLNKIKDFDKIKNPRYIPEYDLISNYVNSVKNWTSFYKIQGTNVENFDIVIYENENDEGNAYEKDVLGAIKKIVEIEKKKP